MEQLPTKAELQAEFKAKSLPELLVFLKVIRDLETGGPLSEQGYLVKQQLINELSDRA